MMRALKILLALVTATGVAQTRTQPAESRYLYTLNCTARLEKFETQTHRKLSTQNLATHSPYIPRHGDEANSLVDGCATYGAVYQPTTHTFYTLSPTTGSMHDGQRHLRILSFHLPTLQPSVTMDVPGDYEEGALPTLMFESSGQIGILAKGAYLRIEGSHLLSAPIPVDLPGSQPPTAEDPFYELDLAAYHVSSDASKTLAYTPLERSGSKFLLASPSSSQGWVFAVADAATHHIVQCTFPFRSTVGNVHLTPGGESVLAQEASAGPVPGTSVTTARLSLLSNATGTVTRSWSEAALSGTYILTITPAGDIVSFHGEQTTFTSLHLRLPRQSVVSLGTSLRPSFFFAGQ